MSSIKKQPIASEDIICRPTCSDCLLLQAVVSEGALRYEYHYSSGSTAVLFIVQRCPTLNMYKATLNIYP